MFTRLQALDKLLEYPKWLGTGGYCKLKEYLHHEHTCFFKWQGTLVDRKKMFEKIMYTLQLNSDIVMYSWTHNGILMLHGLIDLGLIDHGLIDLGLDVIGLNNRHQAIIVINVDFSVIMPSLTNFCQLRVLARPHRLCATIRSDQCVNVRKT